MNQFFKNINNLTENSIFLRKISRRLRYRTIGNGMKILEIFGENRLDFVEKFKNRLQNFARLDQK